MIAYFGMVDTTKIQINTPMKDIMQDHKEFFQLPRTGDIIEGTVIGKESGVLYIDLGSLGTGVVYGVEYFKVHDEIKKMKAGDKIASKLVQLENENGYRELSLKKAEEEKSWHYLTEKYKNHEKIEVKITDANKGGLLAKTGNIAGFIPVSQLAPQNYPRVEGGDKEKILLELKNFVDKIMEVSILDINPEEGKLIFSERAAESDEIKKSLSKYEVGNIVEGEITGIVEFGAFIKFDPMLEGLIHISEMDWSLIEHPRDIVNIGDKVKAKIVDVANDGRVSLSLKQLKDNPWEGIEKRYKQGDKIKGTVNKIASYGALVKIEDGIHGLLHVSEFSIKSVSESKDKQENSNVKSAEEQMEQKIQKDKEYEFEVVSIEPDEYKIALRLVE